MWHTFSQGRPLGPSSSFYLLPPFLVDVSVVVQTAPLAPADHLTRPLVPLHSAEVVPLDCIHIRVY